MNAYDGKSSSIMIAKVLAIGYLAFSSIHLLSSSLYLDAIFHSTMMAIETPGYALMASNGHGTGLDIALIEYVFGDDLPFPRGIMVELITLAHCLVMTLISIIPFVTSFTILSNVFHKPFLKTENKTWVSGLIACLLTARVISAFFLTLETIFALKGSRVSSHVLKCYLIFSIVLLFTVIAIPAIYFSYTSSQIQNIRIEIADIASGDVYEDHDSVPAPFGSFVPERNSEGDGISKMNVSYDPVFLLGDHGTVLVHTHEEFDRLSDRVDQQNTIRLWLQKIDGEWKVVDYYSHA